MKRKTTQSPTKSKKAREMDPGDDEFEVRDLLDVRFNNALGKFEYLLDWEDTIKANGLMQVWDPTWEPEENISDTLLLTFEEQFSRKKARIVEASFLKSQYCSECQSEHKKSWHSGHNCFANDKRLKVSSQLPHNHNNSEATVNRKESFIQKNTHTQRKPSKQQESLSEQSLNHTLLNNSAEKESNHRNEKAQKLTLSSHPLPNGYKDYAPDTEVTPLIRSVHLRTKLNAGPVSDDEDTPLIRSVYSKNKMNPPASRNLSSDGVKRKTSEDSEALHLKKQRISQQTQVKAVVQKSQGESKLSNSEQRIVEDILKGPTNEMKPISDILNCSQNDILKGLKIMKRNSADSNLQASLKTPIKTKNKQLDQSADISKITLRAGGSKPEKTESLTKPLPLKEHESMCDNPHSSEKRKSEKQNISALADQKAKPTVTFAENVKDISRDQIFRPNQRADKCHSQKTTKSQQNQHDVDASDKLKSGTFVSSRISKNSREFGPAGRVNSSNLERNMKVQVEVLDSPKSEKTLTNNTSRRYNLSEYLNLKSLTSTNSDAVSSISCQVKSSQSVAEDTSLDTRTMNHKTRMVEEQSPQSQPDANNQKQSQNPVILSDNLKRTISGASSLLNDESHAIKYDRYDTEKPEHISDMSINRTKCSGDTLTSCRLKSVTSDSVRLTAPQLTQNNQHVSTLITTVQQERSNSSWMDNHQDSRGECKEKSSSGQLLPTLEASGSKSQAKQSLLELLNQISNNIKCTSA
ncbi:hypothetical protein BJ742DRAFT_786554 [Cladochytrium replicatum]|nr:hypothetical protein BJ742DRAFT_786554 [Cladochytrium replicatum]